MHSQTSTIDSDHDGLPDALEQQLLEQFLPSFSIGQHECAGLPAEFTPGIVSPKPLAEDGTIYGQAFLAKHSTPEHPLVELHFYHLWAKDCGARGHTLDTEHVAALVEASSPDRNKAKWTAEYWYAAAHENTVCEVSQIARASTLKAEHHGAKVWVSPGKHASFLNETLCKAGCGADHCEDMTPMKVTQLINLGEIKHPMNGSTFIASTAWPLETKMSTTNFADEPIARLDAMPENDIAWYLPGKHPAQGVIAVSGTTAGAIALGGDDTGAALSLADDKTSNALGTSYHKTKHALGLSMKNVGKALRMSSGDKKDPATP
ncbi:MAG: hypothetical protein PW792_11770 [Acidobacteriaceae bacterium]|nr:hypothetical protein [Acidobacteriaceae bacterium]